MTIQSNGVRRLTGYAAFLALMLSGVGFVTLYRIRQAARHEQPEPGDAIVVFGAAVWDSGPSTALTLRTQHGVELYHRGLAPVVVCSGGISAGRSEPRVMAGLMMAGGVPASALVLDEAGVNTRATVRSIRTLGDGRWRTVLVVSSPYHMLRIVEECRRQGIEALSCSAPSAPRYARHGRLRLLIWDLRQYGREIVAVWTYRLFPGRTGDGAAPK